MNEFVATLLRGLESGAIYALVALGINIPFAATNVFNFAHGELVMVGALFGVILWIDFHVPVILALVIVAITTSIIGGATERIAVRPVMRVRNATMFIVATLGVGYVIQTGFTIGVETNPAATGTKVFPSFLPFEHIYRYGSILIDPDRIMMVPIALLAALGLSIFMRKTNFGRGLGAVADDREGAALRGLPVNQLTLLSFVLGGLLGGLAGFLAGPVTQASVTSGFALTLEGFIAAAVGGIPEINGALVGGVVVGLAEQFAVTYIGSELQTVAELVVLLAVLVWRPQGIVGKEVRTI